MRIYIILIACVFNSSALFNNVPMAQWSTLMPCNQEAACSDFSGVLAFFLKGAHYEVDYSGKKNLLSWTAMHIDFVMCKKYTNLQLFVGNFGSAHRSYHLLHDR